MKRTAIISLFFLCSIVAMAQENKDSCTLEISLLTCSPGTELYSIFGHTAIRVRDTLRGMDIVYNYGTFDDTDPMFYLNFTKGIMRYSLSAEPYEHFVVEYQYEHRSIIAQILNLTCAEKNSLYESLRTNTLEGNRFYDYHFHTDNCTTRAGRIIETNSGAAFSYKNILPDPGPSFRDMIHEYLDRQHQNWSEFGIDMFLGKNLDIKPTNTEAIHFLPDYLFRGMDSASDGRRAMVWKKQIVLNFQETESTGGWVTPMVVFICFFLLCIWFYFLKNKTPLLIFDIIFFSLLGLIGILMAYLWIERIDNVCRNNMNILWALPTHIVAVFFIRKKAAWTKYYFLMVAILATVLMIGFPWWTQRMNIAVLPLLGIIIFRSYHLFQIRNHAEKSSIQG